MTKANPRRQNGHRRTQLRKRLKAMALPCALCGQPIDYGLPSGHPLSFEVDEIIPVSRGGSPFNFDNVQAAHRICNERKGNKIAIDRASLQTTNPNDLKHHAPPIPTTDW